MNDRLMKRHLWNTFVSILLTFFFICIYYSFCDETALLDSSIIWLANHILHNCCTKQKNHPIQKDRSIITWLARIFHPTLVKQERIIWHLIGIKTTNDVVLHCGHCELCNIHIGTTRHFKVLLWIRLSLTKLWHLFFTFR